MSQYHPCFKAPQEIQRNISISEYKSVLNSAYELGFETMYIQPEPFQEEEHRMPDFKKKDPFDWD
jgi:putative pyruvate formate lyase activating enzyme